jgi:hypothetical protein
MARLRREAHARMLGTGLCTRPIELDCRMESPARRAELIIVPQIRLDHGEAIELAELLSFLADWLSGSQKQILTNSLATFVGHTGYDVDELSANLDRFVFLLGISDGEARRVHGDVGITA